MATQTTANKRSGATRPTAQTQKGSTAGVTSASQTVERDDVYGLVSVLYHALQGAETYGKYIEDARKGNDQELVRFFQQTQAEENERATRAKSLLAARLDVTDDEEEEEDDEDDEDEEEEDED